MIILLVSLFGVIHHAGAQTEQWDTYLAKMGNKPGSVLVDMGLMAGAPDSRYPNLVITGPKAHNCNRQGLPDKEEIGTLEDILYATGSFMTGVTAKVLAGTLTYNCQRVNYYYVKDTIGIRNAIARMYNHSHSDYDYTLTIKPDPTWNTYRTFLYPDEATRNWMENEKALTGLMRRGDTLGGQSEITFNLYFQSVIDRKSFLDSEVAKGFKEKRLTESKKPPVMYGLEISRTATLQLDSLNIITAALKKDADKYRGTYSGWVLPIVK